MITVWDVMKQKTGDVWTIGPDATVYQALELMAAKNIGALPVVDEGGRLVGIFSERDYARKVMLKGRTSRDTKIREVDTAPVFTVVEGDGIEACMSLMTEQRMRHLPVMEAGRMVGIVSIGDIVKAIMDDQKYTIGQLEAYISGSRA